MKTLLEIILEPTAEKFQEAFNSKMSELQQYRPRYEFVHGNGYCAYIVYEKTDDIIGIVDKNCVGVCGTCQYSERRSDHVKWVRCPKYGAVNQDKPACEDYIPEVDYEH